MSFELDYFPPAGTNWKWHPKVLNYSPWTCDLSKQKEPELFLWPARISLWVDLKHNKYIWFVEVIDFKHKVSIISESCDAPLEACIAAEKRGEIELAYLIPDWVRIALLNKWRPPA